MVSGKKRCWRFIFVVVVFHFLEKETLKHVHCWYRIFSQLFCCKLTVLLLDMESTFNQLIQNVSSLVFSIEGMEDRRFLVQIPYLKTTSGAVICRGTLLIFFIVALIFGDVAFLLVFNSPSSQFEHPASCQYLTCCLRCCMFILHSVSVTNHVLLAYLECVFPWLWIFVLMFVYKKPSLLKVTSSLSTWMTVWTLYSARACV